MKIRKTLAVLLSAALLLAGCGAAAPVSAAPSIEVQTEEQLNEILSSMSEAVSAAPAESAPASSEAVSPASSALAESESETASSAGSAAPSQSAPASSESSALKPDAGVFTADSGSTVDSAGKVSMSIDCSQAVDLGKFDWLPADGWILKKQSFEIDEGETAFTLLVRVTREKKIHMEYTGSKSSAYIRGIANLYEFDGGDLSGWMIRVNGDYIPVSSGEYTLHDGDEVEWLYTTDYTKEG